MALYAPAGYGKSVLSSQLTGGNGSLCDCSGVRTPREFARRIVQALSGTRPSDQNAFPALAATGPARIDRTDALSALFNLWASTEDENWFTFENAEHLGLASALVPVIERLIALRGRRRIVVCSRAALPMRLARAGPIERVIILKADDLAFTLAETESIAAEAGVDGERAKALYAVAAGWPIVTQALKRSVPDTLDRTTIEHYLADEVLAQSDELTLDVFRACAAIPDPRAIDVARALGMDDAQPILAQLSRESPFLAEGRRGTFAIHPILLDVVSHREAARCRTLLLEAAHKARDAAEVERAAELFLAAGDDADAAAIFENYPLLFSVSPTPMMLGIIARIGRECLERHPRLWAMVAAHSCYAVAPDAWLSEIRYMWRHVRDGDDTAGKINVAFLMTTVGPFYGEYVEALAVLDEIAPLIPTGGAAEAALLSRRAALAAQLGQNARAQELWSIAERHLAGVDITFALASYDIVARIARTNGDRVLEVRALEDALEASRRCGIALFEASALVDATFGAWLAGEHDRFDVRATALRRFLGTPISRGFEHFIDCMDGFPRSARFGYEPPKFRAWAFLIACGASADRVDALWCARAALEAAERAGQPYYIALAGIATAELDETSRAGLRDRVAGIAAAIGSRNFSEAVERWRAGDADLGMLAPLVARLRDVPRTQAPLLHVGVATGTVLHNGEAVDLTPREREIVVLLAAARRPLTAKEVGERLYPDGTSGGSANAVKVSINRVRAKVGKTAVHSSPHGYALVHDGHDDVLEIEGLLATARDPLLSIDARDELEGALAKFERGSDVLIESWEWYAPIKREFSESLRASRALLVRGDLDRGDSVRAIQSAHALASRDLCDEEACELLLRAHMLAGDQTGAMRAFRAYRDALAKELDAEPGDHLLRLIRGEQSPQIKRVAYP